MTHFVEQYRPKILNEIIGQSHITDRLKEFVKAAKKGDDTLPHLMFAGKAGTGKTSTAIALANEIYGEDNENFLELNASDERGIETIRKRVKDFATTVPIGARFNLILLDEADYLTPEAQSALRRIMEKYSNGCRFILSCNAPNRIIEPIQDRCVVFRFKPMNVTDGEKFVMKMANMLSIDITPSASRLIALKSKGSMRSALNVLNAISLVPLEITDELVNELCGFVDKDFALKLFKDAIAGNLDKVDEALITQFYQKGFTVDELLDTLLDVISESSLTGAQKSVLMAKLSDVDYYIQFGCDELRQLRYYFRWLHSQQKR